MKNYHLSVLLAGMSIFAAAAVSSLFAAEIIYVEGSVQVQSGQESSWRKAEKGQQVNIGDRIRTARRSRADVALDEAKKNTVRIEPKTLVVLNSANPGLIDKLDLSSGKVYAKVDDIKSGLAFEVTTPSCVAGVRGSAYSVYAEKDEDEIHAYKDSAFVQAYDANGNLISEFTLPEGFKTFVERFEGPGSLIQVSMREFSRFDRISDEIAAHEQGKTEMRREREDQRTQEQRQSDSIQDAQHGAQTLEELSDIKQQEKENALDAAIETTREHEEAQEPPIVWMETP